MVLTSFNGGKEGKKEGFFGCSSSSGNGNAGVCTPIWKEDRRYDPYTFCSAEDAIAKANEIGCTGYHTHIQDGQTVYMSCNTHADINLNY